MSHLTILGKMGKFSLFQGLYVWIKVEYFSSPCFQTMRVAPSLCTLLFKYKAQELLKIESYKWDCLMHVRGGECEKCRLWGYVGKIKVHPIIEEVSIVIFLFISNYHESTTYTWSGYRCLNRFPNQTFLGSRVAQHPEGLKTRPDKERMNILVWLMAI